MIVSNSTSSDSYVKAAGFSLGCRCLIALFTLCAVHDGNAWSDVWSMVSPEVARHREGIDQMNREIASLGEMSRGAKVEPIGAQYHMMEQPPAQSPTVQLDFGYSRAFDCVTVVPAITQIEGGRTATYAFPRAFRVDASDDPEFSTFHALGQVTDTALEAEEALPIVLRFSKIEARYLRVTVTELARFAERWTFALGEIFVTHGNHHVGIDAQVRMRSAPKLKPIWHPQYLVDGMSMLGPPIVEQLPKYDGVYALPTGSAGTSRMLLRFHRTAQIDEIRLQPIHARQGAGLQGYAFPERFQVELFRTDEFQEPFFTYDKSNEAFTNPGNHQVVIPVPRVEAKVLRITCLKPSPLGDRGRFGLAEIQVYSGDENMALTSMAEIPSLDGHDGRTPDLLVDGFSSYGKLIELPEWIDRWDRYRRARLGLRQHQAALSKEIESAQRRAFAGAALVACLLVVVAVLWGMIRMRHQRLERSRFRGKLARDLHDEIGSNLAAIARLGEVATLGEPDSQHASDWQTVRELALECNDSMRETLWLLGGPSQDSGDLVGRLRRAADRMLSHVDIQWQQIGNPLAIDDGEPLGRELFLAFKEIIANIAKHAQADQVTIRLDVNDSQIEAMIQDDGAGFSGREEAGMGLSNIRQRIRKLGGEVTIDSVVGVGTTVQFNVPLKK